MTGRRLVARRTYVGIDLDDVACYGAIYGFDVGVRNDDPVLSRGLVRLLDLLDEVGGRATFFCIGRTVDTALDDGGEAAAALRRMVRAGHEIGHHGYAHDYRLVDAPRHAFEADLDRGLTALERLGTAPVGFRAPGYTHDGDMLDTLVSRGFRYDASVLPSWGYFLARRAVQGLVRLRGRVSASHPRIPWRDFLHTEPFRSHGELWSLPISVTPVWRLPMVGTFLLAGPKALRRHLEREARRAGVLHLELHGLDAVDASDPEVPPALVRYAPELRVPVTVRLERLRRLLLDRPRPCEPLAAWVDTLDRGPIGQGSGP